MAVGVTTDAKYTFVSPKQAVTVGTVIVGEGEGLTPTMIFCVATQPFKPTAVSLYVVDTEPAQAIGFAILALLKPVVGLQKYCVPAVIKFVPI